MAKTQPASPAVGPRLTTPQAHRHTGRWRSILGPQEGLWSPADPHTNPHMSETGHGTKRDSHRGYGVTAPCADGLGNHPAAWTPPCTLWGEQAAGVPKAAMNPWAIGAVRDLQPFQVPPQTSLGSQTHRGPGSSSVWRTSVGHQPPRPHGASKGGHIPHPLTSSRAWGEVGPATVPTDPQLRGSPGQAASPLPIWLQRAPAAPAQPRSGPLPSPQALPS